MGLDGSDENRPLAVLKQLYADALGADKASERTAAAKEFLDRVYGKATAALELSGPNGSTVQMVVELPTFLPIAVTEHPDNGAIGHGRNGTNGSEH